MHRTRTLRHAAAWTAGAALVIAASATATADAAALKRSTATASAQVTVRVTRTETAVMSATGTATNGLGVPIRVTMSAPATSTMTSAVSAKGTRKATARAATKSKANARALSLARKRARAAATASATKAAAAAAQAKARAAAEAAARAEAERLAQQRAKDQASATSSPSASAVNDAPQASPKAPCGTTTFTDSSGQTYTCSFSDEFDGTALDTSKWTAWNNANWWGGSDVCYYDDPEHVAVEDGTLDLSVTRMPSTSSCMTSDTAPKYGAAVVHTKSKFAQTYGVFQARIKFAAGYGLHHDFWLFPEDTSSGDRAEIDIAEPYGVLPDTMFGVTHHANLAGQEVGATGRCDVKNWGGAYHVYGVRWTPDSLTYTVDGATCATYHNWQGQAGLAGTSPFNRDFFMILQSTVDDGVFAPAPTDDTVLPATTKVDWVRVWK